MGTSTNGAPDLANILKTLSSFNPATDRTNSYATNPVSEHTNHDTTVSSYGLGGRDVTRPSAHIQQNSPHASTQAPSTVTSTTDNNSGPDPSTITSWSTALRCVMKTVAQNESLQSRIRRLISTQHDHERSWWRARETLLAKQKSRVERQKKLDEVLRSVGGNVTSGIGATSPDDDNAEIKTYDEKVYRALTEMSKALSSELRALGIPFFAIKYELVLPQSTATGNTTSRASRHDDTHPKPCISTEELHSFQQRMLELLQDLCKE